MRAAPLALLLLVPLVAACGDDGGGSSSSVTDAAVAQGACRLLVDWTDDVAQAINDTEDEMVPGADIPGLMTTAIDAVIARTDELAGALQDLRYPDSDGGRAFAQELHDGVAAARDDLAGFQEEIRAIPDPDPESVQYRKSQMVIELEKPRSLVKPDVQGDLGDEHLEAAIAAEEDCRFVTRTQ